MILSLPTSVSGLRTIPRIFPASLSPGLRSSPGAQQAPSRRSVLHSVPFSLGCTKCSFTAFSNSKITTSPGRPEPENHRIQNPPFSRHRFYLIPRARPYQVAHCGLQSFSLITNTPVFFDVWSVLQRPNFPSYMKKTETAMQFLLQLISSRSWYSFGRIKGGP